MSLRIFSMIIRNLIDLTYRIDALHKEDRQDGFSPSWSIVGKEGSEEHIFREEDQQPSVEASIDPKSSIGASKASGGLTISSQDD